MTAGYTVSEVDLIRRQSRKEINYIFGRQTGMYIPPETQQHIDVLAELRTQTYIIAGVSVESFRR